MTGGMSVKIQPAVWKETGHIALGVVLGDIVMLVVFALLKRLDYTVLLGALLGSVAAVGNFLLLGLGAQRAMEDPDRAKALVQRSYMLRMLGLVAVLVLGVAAPCFHVIAVIVPILMPSVTIYVMRLLGLDKPKEKGGEKE